MAGSFGNFVAVDLNEVQRASQNQFARQSDRYGKGHILENVDDVRAALTHIAMPSQARVLDVATGGGHVARRLREAGATVVTVDPAPGMQADTTASAEDLPFADGSFDAVATRLAAHHFADALGAVKEMARVAAKHVVVCDNTFVSESSEEADRVRDPSHVRNYAQAEWGSFFELAGLEVAEERYLERPLEIEPWLARVDCTGEDAARVRELLGHRIVDGVMALPTLVLKSVKG